MTSDTQEHQGSSAYVSWLQNALQEQAAILSERDGTIADLQAKLADVTQMLALGMNGSGSSNNTDTEADTFLIDRIVDEEDKNTRLEEKLREASLNLNERGAQVAALTDETHELREALRQVRTERYNDVVKTHAAWATQHLVHTPASLPAEAIEVLLEDLQSRRTDVLHVMQRLEDWYSSLSSHHYAAMRVQGINSRPKGTNRVPPKAKGRGGVTSFTAELKKRSDTLFNRLRGECLVLTHEEIASISTGHLSRCRADTSSFLSAFRHIKSIIQGAGLMEAGSSSWVRDDLQAERAMTKLDTASRAQLIESTRELVLSYDSNPRSTQSNHGRLVEELSANLYAIVTALRVSSAATTNVLGFPSTLQDSRISSSPGVHSFQSSASPAPLPQRQRTTNTIITRGRVSSSGPSPISSRLASPHPGNQRAVLGSLRAAYSNATPSTTTRTPKVTPRSVSPFSRQSTAPTQSAIGSSIGPLVSPRVGSKRVPSAGRAVQRVQHESPPPPSNLADLAVPATARTDAKVVPPPAFSPATHASPVQDTPVAEIGERNRRSTFTSPQSPGQGGGGGGGGGGGDGGKETSSPLHGASHPPPRPVRGEMLDGDEVDNDSVAVLFPQTSGELGEGGGGGGGEVPADGFLSAAQRREVKERAMGNYRTMRVDGEDDDDTPNSRAQMMQQLMSWRSDLGTRLANREVKRSSYDDELDNCRVDAYGAVSEEIWSDDNDGSEGYTDHRAWSPGSPQEFDSPFNITHPDYSNPEVAPGPSILRASASRQSSICDEQRGVKFAADVKDE